MTLINYTLLAILYTGQPDPMEDYLLSEMVLDGKGTHIATTHYFYGKIAPDGPKKYVKSYKLTNHYNRDGRIGHQKTTYYHYEDGSRNPTIEKSYSDTSTVSYIKMSCNKSFFSEETNGIKNLLIKSYTLSGDGTTPTVSFYLYDTQLRNYETSSFRNGLKILIERKLYNPNGTIYEKQLSDRRGSDQITDKEVTRYIKNNTKDTNESRISYHPRTKNILRLHSIKNNHNNKIERSIFYRPNEKITLKNLKKINTNEIILKSRVTQTSWYYYGKPEKIVPIYRPREPRPVSPELCNDIPQSITRLGTAKKIPLVQDPSSPSRKKTHREFISPVSE